MHTKKCRYVFNFLHCHKLNTPCTSTLSEKQNIAIRPASCHGSPKGNHDPDFSQYVVLGFYINESYSMDSFVSDFTLHYIHEI